MAAVLLQALERPEVNKLPKGVQNKLERFISELQRENGALKTQHERLAADCEQQFFDVEKRLTDSQEQVVSHTRVYTALKYENRRLVEELNKLKGLDEESSGEKPAETQATQGKPKYEIEAERRELARQLEKKNQEVDNLTEQVKGLDARVQESVSAKVALQLQLDQLQAAEVSIQHRERRVEQEKELVQNQNSWLSAELQRKTDELLVQNRDHDKTVLDLRHHLDTAREELTRVQSQVTSLKNTSETQQKRAEDLTSKLKEAKDQQTNMEERYQTQLNASVKLADLYKAAAAEAESRNTELSRAVEELTALVKTSAEANQSLAKQLSDLEGSKVRQEAELQDKINQMEKNMEALRRDTHQAPVLTEEELEVMCPTAAAVAKIVKPGMKFMELYNAFVLSQDQLHEERVEARRVAAVLDQIVLEVESKAPALRRQRDDYQNLQSSMTSLCTRLEAARKEVHGLQKESDEANKRCASLEREKQALQRQLDDTAQQVRVLLVALEQARGGGQGAAPQEDVSSAAISSSSEALDPEASDGGSEVISPRQVVFRSVEELQRQNQRLLGRLRALGEQREREENEAHAARVCELEQALERAREEAEAAVEQRNQQKQLSESNARQRDMYRILLSQSGFPLPPGPAQDSGPGPAPVATRSAPFRPVDSQTTLARNALKQVSDAFTTYKREKAENDRLMNETNDRLKKQLLEVTTLNTTLTSRLSSASRRYDMLQGNVSGYRREVAALQEKTNKMAAAAQKHENIIHTMTHDLRSANEKLATAEVRMESLVKERDLVRGAEERLVQEKEAVMTQQRHQELLLTNLQAIKVTLERSEGAGQQRQTAERRRLEAELSGLKTKLEQEVERRHTLGRTLDAQLLEAKKQLQSQNALHQKTKELLCTAEQQVATLRQQLSSESPAPSPAPGQAATNPRAPFRASPRAPAPSQVSLLQRELAEVRGAVRQGEELTSDLTERLKSASTNVEQYRSLVVSLEDSLNQEKQARGLVEVALREAQEVQRHLEAKLLEAERDKLNQQEERRKAVDAVEKQVLELRCSLQGVQVELQHAGERAATAVAQEQKATQGSLQQTRLAQEAQGRYERELRLHAADVEALQAARQRDQRGAEERRTLEERCSTTTAELQQHRSTWSQQQDTLKEELQQQVRRAEELQRQNALLHQQVEALGDKVAAATKPSSNPLLPITPPGDEGRTTEQTLQILRFVRREKEIVETRLEVAEAAARRHSLQEKHQAQEIRELQDNLNTERERLQANQGSLAGQEERLRKAELAVPALEDQNKSLRDATHRLETELQQAQAKVRRLEADLAPLQASLALVTQRSAALQTDSKLLEDDNKRLKARVQQKDVQQKEVEVEEVRRQQVEREAQGRRLQQMAEEAAKMKAELARSSASASSSASQLAGLRESSARLTSERDALKAEQEARALELLEKNKTITQVKKIGRRYKTQYEELKAQHDKLVSESSAPPRLEQQEQLQNAQRELAQARQDHDSTRSLLQTAQKELTQARAEQTQAQAEGDKTRQELQAARQEAERIRTETQQAQAEVERARQDLQGAQRDLAQARQTSAQEAQKLQTSLKQAEARGKDLEGQLGHTQKALAEREAEVQQLQQSSQMAQTSEAAQPQSGEELNALRQELQERRSQEELLRQQMADKEEKTKKAFLGAKQKINQLNNAKEQLSKEKEQLSKEKDELSKEKEQLSKEKDVLCKEKEELCKEKEELCKEKEELCKENLELCKEKEEQQAGREEMEVRLSALKSQYEGRLQRQDRELRDLQHRDDAQEQSNTKEQQRAAEQRQISLKSSPAADRTSSSDPPTANIRPTPSSPAPKPGPASSSKATPRASIRPMVTPATVAMPTPTATVMPTTQAESQEEGGCVSVFSSVLAPPTSLSQPISCQTTAFVTPTQQQAMPPAEPANHEERPSTSSAVTGPGPKRVREEQMEAGPESSDTPPEEPDQSPVTKRPRVLQRRGLEEDIDEGTDGELEGGESQDTPDDSQELPEEGVPVLAEVEEEVEEGGVSQSVPSDPQDSAHHHEVIVIDTDSSGSQEEEEEEEEEEAERYEEEEEEDDEEDRDGGMGEEDEKDRDGGMGEEDEEDRDGEMGGRGDEGDQPFEEAEEEPGAVPSEPASENDDSMGGGATDSAHKMADSQSGEGSGSSFPLADAPRELRFHPGSGPPRLPQPPRRPPHPLPPRLYIQPPAPELGPPPHRQATPLRRQSVGRGPQLTPGVGSMQHFFDDDDRMVPSTPTLVVPHRTDGFAEAIHSPQVAGVPRFRFGPPDDLMQQAGSSHSDLGQLASQGGLGMYESPLFLAAQEEESGGRSVPTTPLQVAAPVSVFAESLPADVSDLASQSVPMVTTSTASQSVPMVNTSTGLAVAGDDGDEVFMEGESSGEEQPPPNSQEPLPSSPSSSSSSSSSAADTSKPCARPPPPRTAAQGLGTARTLLRRGVAFTRARRGNIR